MSENTTERLFRIRHSEKCFRFKPEAFLNHAPEHPGIYELVTFDAANNPTVLYIGAAFDRSIRDCLEGHADGTLPPTADDLLRSHPNLYFDYLEETGARTLDDARDLHWWLVQKHKPAYNNVAETTSSNRSGSIRVEEID